MENLITYKGFTGTVQYDKFDHMYYGKVREVPGIVYEGKNMYLLLTAFHQAVDEYSGKYSEC